MLNSGSAENETKKVVRFKKVTKFQVTTLRYMIFYADVLVSDSYKIKSQIKFFCSKDHAFDMQMRADL
jgi:hypothetical protein